jgi:hypothetical protein
MAALLFTHEVGGCDLTTYQKAPPSNNTILGMKLQHVNLEGTQTSTPQHKSSEKN